MKAPQLGKQKQRTPDDLWLTNRCQLIIDTMNRGELSEERALAELESVGNTQQQALLIIERHRGRPQSGARPPKPKNPLRPAKR